MFEDHNMYADSHHLDHLPDGSTVMLHPYESTCTMVVKAPADFVAEVGDQLGSLASTLRESPISDGLLSCSPKVAKFHTPVATDKRDATINATCKLRFDLAASQDIIPGPPGFCWARVFRNPLLVTEYPVRPRDGPDTGLEMSLGLMAELVRSRQLTSIRGRVMLKGFCYLLVATADAGDAILWHYLYNSTGERISYYDTRLESIQNDLQDDIVLESLKARRNIVGWCSDICEYSGMPSPRPSWSIC